MVGLYDFDLDQYIEEQHFAIDNQWVIEVLLYW
jgi:hypothetical protein